MVDSETDDLVLGSEEEVIRIVTREIAERRLGPGSKLPTERDLTLRSRQSRAVVRRALARLEADGHVVRHIGRGTFIPATNPDVGELYPVDPASPAEIMTVRLLLEPQLMPLVVTAATPADFIEMRRCLEGGEKNQTYEEFEGWDTAFHRSLASATHNGLLARMIEMTNDARHQPLWQKLKRRSHSAEHCQSYMRDHREIFDALADLDGASAQAAMRAHLLRVRANILGDSP